MKKQINGMICVLLAMLLSVSMVACGKKTESGNLWDNAVYTEDTELGTGAKTITVSVVTEEKTVLFTLHTDQENLEETLLEQHLIAGEKGPYGMYVKTVNGILADYDVDQTYWGMNRNGESMQTGVSDTEIIDGDSFEFVHTK